MIAPAQSRRKSDRPRFQPARTIVLDEVENGSVGRVKRLIGLQPELALATAVIIGVALGWLVKRKQW